MKQSSAHTKDLPLCELKDNLAPFVARIHRSGRPIVVTHRGKRAGIAMGISEYQAMVEEIETLRDIQTALTQSAQGKTVSHTVASRRLRKHLSDAG